MPSICPPTQPPAGQTTFFPINYNTQWQFVEGNLNILFMIMYAVGQIQDVHLMFYSNLSVSPHILSFKKSDFKKIIDNKLK